MWPSSALPRGAAARPPGAFRLCAHVHLRVPCLRVCLSLLSVVICHVDCFLAGAPQHYPKPTCAGGRALLCRGTSVATSVAPRPPYPEVGAVCPLPCSPSLSLALSASLSLILSLCRWASTATPLRMNGGGSDDKPRVGFLGMGIMGVPMSINLVKAGFPVTVWNRTPDKCAPAVQAGATQAATASEVVKSCDITFAMLADPVAAEAVALGPDGVAEAMCAGKGYVDVSTIDPDSAAKIAAAIRNKGGAYLEAPVSGSKKPAEDGTLIFLCAGDEALYTQCREALEVMGKKVALSSCMGRWLLVRAGLRGSVDCRWAAGGPGERAGRLNHV